MATYEVAGSYAARFSHLIKDDMYPKIFKKAVCAVYLVSTALLAGCGAAAGSDETGEEPLDRLSQAQIKFTPTSCSGSQVPGTFVDQCVLAGGERVECDGGVAWCCRGCTKAEGCDERCSQNPDDLDRTESANPDGIIIDTVQQVDSPAQAPIGQPIIDTVTLGDTLPWAPVDQPMSDTLK